jgi:hypothetical protein
MTRPFPVMILKKFPDFILTSISIITIFVFLRAHNASTWTSCSTVGFCDVKKLFWLVYNNAHSRQTTTKHTSNVKAVDNVLKNSRRRIELSTKA